MNAAEVLKVLTGCVKSFGDPASMRPSEDRRGLERRQILGIRDQFDQLRRFTDALTFRKCCLDFAERFIDGELYRPAFHACLQMYWQDVEHEPYSITDHVDNPPPSGGAALAETLAVLSLKVRAGYFTALSRIGMILEADPRMVGKSTCDGVTNRLHEVAQAMQQAFRYDEKLCHLIFNGTVYLMKWAQYMMQRGYHRQAAVFVAFSARACDSVVALSATRYLDWRVRIYDTLAACYDTCEDFRGALSIAGQMQAKVEELSYLEHLDVVPPPAATEAALNAAINRAKLLATKFTLLSTGAPPKLDEAAAAAVGAAGGKPDKKQQAVAAAGASADFVPITSNLVLERLTALFPGTSDALSRVVWGLLRFRSGDKVTRISNGLAPSAAGGPSVEWNPARLAMFQATGDALSQVLGPAIEECNKRRAPAAVRGATPDVPDDKAHGKGATAAPKGKPAPSDAATAAPNVKAAGGKAPAGARPTAEPLSGILDHLSTDTLDLCARALLAEQHYDALDKLCTVALDQTPTAAPLVPKDSAQAADMKLARLLADVLRTSHNGSSAVTAASTAGLLRLGEGITSLRSILVSSGRTDIVEHAALVLLHRWKGLDVDAFHELPNAVDVLFTALDTLVHIDHHDAILVASLASTVADLLERSSQFKKSAQFCRACDGYFSRHLLFHSLTHTSSGQTLKGVVEGETFDLRDLPRPAEDSVWVRTVADARVQLFSHWCSAHLHAAVSEKQLEADRAAAAKLELLENRRARAALLGTVTLKEERAMEAAAQQVAAAAAATSADGKPVSIPPVDETIRALLAHTATMPEATVFRAVALVAACPFVTSATQRKKNLAEAHDILISSSGEVSSKPNFVALCLLARALIAQSTSAGLDGVAHLVDSAKVVLTQAFLVRGGAGSAEDKSGGATPKVWDANPAAWDHLDDAIVNRCSSQLLRLLGATMVDLAGHAVTTAATLPEEGAFLDDPDDGVDVRRLNRQQAELEGLRATNLALCGIELATALREDTTVVTGIRTVANALAPLFRARPVSFFLLRPFAAVNHAMRSLQPRRWHDATLQAAVARILRGGLDLCRRLPTAGGTRRKFQEIVHSSVLYAYAAVRDHPNPRQQLHLQRTAAEIAFLRSALRPIRIEGILAEAGNPVAAAAAASPTAPAAKGKKGAAAAAAQPAATSEFKTQSVFLRSAPSEVDRLPPEFSDLVEDVLFNAAPSGAGLPGLDAPDAASTAVSALPEGFLPLASALASSVASGNPAATVAKLGDLRSSIMYPKLAAIIATHCVARKWFDAAQTVATDAIAEIRTRHAALIAIETEYLAALHAAFPPAAAAATMSEGSVLLGASSGPTTSPRTRALAVLTRRIALLRRRMALHKMRALRCQFDEPSHARLRLVLSTIALRDAVRAKQQPLAAAAAPKAQAAAPGADAKKPPAAAQTPAAPPPAASAAKSKGKEDPNSAVPKTPRDSSSGVESEWWKPRVAAVEEAVRAFIIFSRNSLWNHAYNALLHVAQAARLGFGVPKSVLHDAVTSALKAFAPVTNDGGGAADGNGGMSSTISSLASSTATTPVPALLGQLGGVGGSGGDLVAAQEGFTKIEQHMKSLCSEIVNMLRRAAALGAFGAPVHEVDSLQPPAIKTGRDYDVPGGVFSRTTSLFLMHSTIGMQVGEDETAKRAAFGARVAKIFNRKQVELTEDERVDRLAIEQQWNAQYPRLNSSDDEDEERDTHTEASTTGRSAIASRAAAAKAKKEAARRLMEPKAIKGNRHAGLSVLNDAVMGPLMSLEEIYRCFHYAAQTMQYGRLKISCTQICLDFNDATRQRFAPRLLPYVANLQSATNQTSLFQVTVRMLYDASKDEVRATKLVQGAYKAWAKYKESEPYSKAMARLGNTLLPGLTAAGGGARRANDDAVSTVSGSNAAGFGGGAGSYKEVANAFQAAIDYLRQKQSRQRLVACLAELGCVHLIHRNRADAQRSWEEAVDATLGAVRSLSQWRTLIGPLIQQPDRLSTWRVLWCVVALSKLAMFSFVDNQTQAVEACFLAAELLRALTTQCSLSAPQRPFDLVEFEIEELPGGTRIDRDSSLIEHLGVGLSFIAHQLSLYDLPIQASICTSMLEHVALFNARSVEFTTIARSIRAVSAAKVGNLKVALRLVAEVHRGRRLPDASLSQLGITPDADLKVGASKPAAVGGAAAAGAPGKAAGGKPAAGAAAGAPKPGEDSTSAAGLLGGGDLPEFNNAKPLTDEGNAAAVDAVGLIVTSQLPVGLSDALVAEYGDALCAYILTCTASVFTLIAESDPALAMGAPSQSGDDSGTAGGPAGGKKKEPTQPAKPSNAAATDASLATANAAASALATVEKILKTSPFLASMSATLAPAASSGALRPDSRKGAPSAASAAPQPNHATVTPAVATTPQLGDLISITSALLAARIQVLRGFLSSSSGDLKALVTLYEEGAITGYTAVPIAGAVAAKPSVSYPSFIARAPGRLLIQVLRFYSDILVQERRTDAALHALAVARDVCDATRDEFSLREIAVSEANVLLLTGRRSAALAAWTLAANSSKHLDWGSFEPFAAFAAIALTNLHQHRTPSAASSASGDRLLEQSVDGLVQWCRHAGLNLAIESSASPTALLSVACHNQRIALSVPVMMTAAWALCRLGKWESALRIAETVQRMAQQSAVFSGERLTQAVVEADICALMARRHVAEGTGSGVRGDGATGGGVQAVLEKAVQTLVSKGTHDVSFLLVVLETALDGLKASSSKPPTDEVHALLRAAAKIAALRGRLAHGLSPQAVESAPISSPVPVDDAMLAALSPAIVEAIEEENRRFAAPQSVFVTESAAGAPAASEVAGGKPSATAASSASAGGGAKGGGAPTSAAPRAVGWNAIIGVYTALLVQQRATVCSGNSLLAMTREIQVSRLRSFIQARGGSAVVGDIFKAQPSEGSSSIMFLERAPPLLATPPGGAAASAPKAGAAIPNAKPWQLVALHRDDAPKPAAAVGTKSAAVFTIAVAWATAAPQPETPVAVAAPTSKPAKGAAAAAALEPLPPAVGPSVYIELSLDPVRTAAVHFLARKVLRLMDLTAQLNAPSSEPWDADAHLAKDIKGGGKGGGDAKSAAGSDAKKGAAAAGGRAATTDGSTPPPPMSPTPFAALDEELHNAKAQVLADFVEALIEGSQPPEGTVPTSKLYPSFPLQQHHVMFIAEATQPHGAHCAPIADKELCLWLFECRRLLSV